MFETSAGTTPGSMRAVSVIATVRNEAGSIGDLVTGLVTGDRPPDEIVIADAASDDGTRQVLTELAGRHPTLRVIDVVGNRSVGRNRAIGAAGHDLIASVDGGCRPHRQWLARIVEPLEAGADWVGGFYRPVGSSRQVCIGLTMVYVLEEASGEGFLPSARSMAFTRSAWEAVGGFPEGLEVSEDTSFDERLRAAGYNLEFVPDALVDWEPPATFRRQAAVVFAWSHSDGVAGVNSYGYRKQLVWVAISVLLGGLAALVDWRLASLGLIPVMHLMWRETRHKYRWTTGWSRFLWIPTAWAVGLASRLLGFVAGRLRRGRGGV